MVAVVNEAVVATGAPAPPTPPPPRRAVSAAARRGRRRRTTLLALGPGLLTLPVGVGVGVPHLVEGVPSLRDVGFAQRAVRAHAAATETATADGVG